MLPRKAGRKASYGEGDPSLPSYTQSPPRSTCMRLVEHEKVQPQPVHSIHALAPEHACAAHTNAPCPTPAHSFGGSQAIEMAHP
eukprot:6198897-Pleurochrysis_carterae.AAC.2